MKNLKEQAIIKKVDNLDRKFTTYKLETDNNFKEIKEVIYGSTEKGEIGLKKIVEETDEKFKEILTIARTTKTYLKCTLTICCLIGTSGLATYIIKLITRN